MSKKVEYVTGEYYHIYNRGVEKRNIFLDGADYFRFIQGMKEFNDIEATGNLCSIPRRATVRYIKDKKEAPIIKFITYALMPNHFHFIVQQIKDNGISKFMQRLGTGYTKYFNKRYGRNGVLFQGVFRAKHISTDEYLLHLSRYIHLNPLNLNKPDWIEQGIENKDKAYNFLMKYDWHSLPFWLKNRANLVRLYPQIVLDQFSSKEEYKDFVLDWVEKDMDKINDIVIE